MLYAGIDLGSTTGKIAVVDDASGCPELVAQVIEPSGFAPGRLTGLLLKKAAQRCVEAGVLDAASLGADAAQAFAHICVTGYGRESIDELGLNMSEISCHAAGAHWARPEARTVIDIGGQDLKVISLGDDGSVLNFAMNDKCAAGTGRFFEAMARILRCDMDELGELSLSAKGAVPITSTCSVFAESEVVALINREVPRESIARGIHDSIADRIFGMAQRVGLVPEVVLTGGCGKSRALRQAVESRMGAPVADLGVNPQIVGAMGAALLARKRFGGD